MLLPPRTLWTRTLRLRLIIMCSVPRCSWQRDLLPKRQLPACQATTWCWRASRCCRNWAPRICLQQHCRVLSLCRSCNSLPSTRYGWGFAAGVGFSHSFVHWLHYAQNAAVSGMAAAVLARWNALAAHHLLVLTNPKFLEVRCAGCLLRDYAACTSRQSPRRIRATSCCKWSPATPPSPTLPTYPPLRFSCRANPPPLLRLRSTRHGWGAFRDSTRSSARTPTASTWRTLHRSCDHHDLLARPCATPSFLGQRRESSGG